MSYLELLGIPVSISGFTETKRPMVLELIQELQMIPDVNFSRKRHQYLITQEYSGAKFEKAQEWGIPIVTLNWLITMVHQQRYLSPVGFQLVSREVLKSFVIYLSPLCKVRSAPLV